LRAVVRFRLEPQNFACGHFFSKRTSRSSKRLRESESVEPALFVWNMISTPRASSYKSFFHFLVITKYGF
jgi:hypothetical protein